MIHWAVLQTYASSGTDGFGGPNAPTYEGSPTANLRCWFYAKSEREVIDGEKSAVLGRHKMIIPLGTTITEKDRIGSIEDRLGNIIMANTMRIHSVTHRHTHLELEVEEVSGDAG